MIEYLSKFLYVLPARKQRLIPLLLSFVLVSVLETFGIGLIGPFINLAMNPSSVTDVPVLYRIYSYLEIDSPIRFIATLGLLIVVVFCVKSFISWRVQVYVFKFSFKQKGELAIRLMHAYLTAPYTFYLDKNSANIVQNVVSETHTFSASILITLLTSISNFTIVLSLSALLFATNLVAVLAILCLLLPLIFMFHSFRDRIETWGKRLSQSNEAMIRTINHGLGGVKETKVIGCEHYFENQIAAQANDYAQAASAFYAFKISPRVIVETILVLFLVGFTSIYLIVNQNIESLTATLSVFALASIRLIPAISNLTSGLSILRNCSYPLNKLYHDLKTLERVENNDKQAFATSYIIDSASGLAESRPELALNDKIVLDRVGYRYPSAAEPALQNVSLTIKKGESVAFIGKSGAGKTTIVDVILGLLQPNTGDISIGDRSIYKNLRAWQNLVGYIPQSIFLVDDTIERNVAFGVPDRLIDSDRLVRAIEAAQLTEVVANLPDGLKTEVGERGVMLSGGQRQRVGIARALYHEREILILDEATAALDNETESLVTEAIKSLSGTKTMIIIAHRLTTIEHCDRVYLMDKGRVVKSGSYQEVVLNDNLLPV